MCNINITKETWSCLFSNLGHNKQWFDVLWNNGLTYYVDSLSSGANSCEYFHEEGARIYWRFVIIFTYLFPLDLKKVCCMIQCITVFGVSYIDLNCQVIIIEATGSFSDKLTITKTPCWGVYQTAVRRGDSNVYDIKCDRYWGCYWPLLIP